MVKRKSGRSKEKSQIPILIRDRISELQSSIIWLNADILFYNSIREKATRPDQFLLLMIHNRMEEKASCIHELNRITEDLAEMYPFAKHGFETILSLAFSELSYELRSYKTFDSKP